MNQRLAIAILSQWVVISSVFFSLAFAQEFRYDSHGKRDPFVSPTQVLTTGTQVSAGELRLEGVIVDPVGSSYAIVNGQIVREGDTLEGFLIKKVQANQVVFEKAGEIFEVALRQDEDLLGELGPDQEAKSQKSELKK